MTENCSRLTQISGKSGALVRAFYRLFSYLSRLVRPSPELLFSAHVGDFGIRRTSLHLHVRWNDFSQNRSSFWIRISERKTSLPRFSLHQVVEGSKGELLFCVDDEFPPTADLVVELLDERRVKIDAAGTTHLRLTDGVGVTEGEI